MVPQVHQKIKRKNNLPNDAIKRIITRCQERHKKTHWHPQKTRVFHRGDRDGKPSAEYSVSYAAGEND